MKSTVSELRAVRTLLATRQQWTQGAWARDVTGEHVNARDPDAVCWCLSGALERCCGVASTAPLIVAEAAAALYEASVIGLNDTAPAEQAYDLVCEVLDVAISEAICQERGRWTSR